jgi:hypothetical protein
MLEGHIYEESYQEYPDEVSHVEDPEETFVSMLPLDEDEVLISTLPIVEDIQASDPFAHQEENMMSCNPLEDLDDTLFHDLGSEEGLEEPLDATNPFWKTKTNNYALMLHIILVTSLIN